MNKFLFSPPILVTPKKNSTLILYLEVSKKETSSVLVHDDYDEERPVYFVSKVLKGAKIHYQKIERLVLAVVLAVRKLKKYFLGHLVIIKTNYPIKRILKNLDLAGRIVA